MESRRLRAGGFAGICACAIVSVAMFASPAASAEPTASPVLEFVAPGSAFPIGFEVEGGEVTAVLEGFESEVRCTDSEGDGKITGPRSTESHYVFTGCKAVGGGGQPCQSEGASSEEIVAEELEAELVYLDQGQHEVAMLLNPNEGVYMNFECGGEEVEALGPFLSPVGPVNRLAMSFTAKLERSGAQQTPSEYENLNGERLQAIPTGKRGSHEPATTGVELDFAIHPDAPLEIRAVSAEEVEAKQREEEASAKKRQEEEAASKKHQEEEDAGKRRQEEEAAAAAKQRREQQRAKAKRLRRHRLRKALKRCAKFESKHRRTRCVTRARMRYGHHKGHRKHKTTHRAHRAVTAPRRIA